MFYILKAYLKEDDWHLLYDQGNSLHGIWCFFSRFTHLYKKASFYRWNQLLLITARLNKIKKHRLSCCFCSSSFFSQKLFEEFLMIFHPILKQVHAVVWIILCCFPEETIASQLLLNQLQQVSNLLCD